MNKEKTEEDTRKERRQKEEKEKSVGGWKPKTKLGQEVRDGKVKDIDEILESKRKILESEIIDTLLNVQSDLIAV